MTTINISTTRVLTAAELAHAQGIVDILEPPAGSRLVVQSPSIDGAFGGTVTIPTDGDAPQEQFWRALVLPPVPPCATGDVTLDFSIDLTVSGTVGSPAGTIAVLDRTDPTIAAVVGNASSTPGNWSGTLNIPGQTFDLAKYQAGDYYVALVTAETAQNGPAQFDWSNAVASLTYDATACASVTVSPSSLDIPGGCACEPTTLTVTNSTGGALDGHLLALSVPTDWHTRLAAITYSGGASGIANAPSAVFIVAAWPDGGSVAIACELCPGCSSDGVYGLTVDITDPDGALVASEPVSVGRGVPAPPIAPIAPRVAAPQAAPAKAAAKTTAKRKATK